MFGVGVDLLRWPHWLGYSMDRVTDEADPNRCKGSVGHGQCMYAAVEGSDYCRVHARAYAAPEKGMRR